jgi:Tol biopolymer transport system component
VGSASSPGVARWVWRAVPVVVAGVVLGFAVTSCSGSVASPPAPSAASRTVPASSGSPNNEVPTATGWLAYQTTDGSNDRVHLVHVDGSGDHAIAPQLPGRTAHPDFSRDGTHLTFDQLSDPNGSDPDQVYIAAADGTHPRLIAPCRPPACLDRWEPAWSPDGRHLVVSTAGGRLTANGPTRFGLAIVDVATQHVTTVLDHPSRDGQDHFARWSADGSTLVFWREQPAADGSTRTAIFRVDATGHHLRQLTPWPMLAGDPDWSPNGSSIVFSTHPLLTFDSEGESELFLMNPNGTGVQQLTHNGSNGPRATQPRWTPNGPAILYTQTGPSGLPRHIYTLLADGSNDSPVLTERSLYTHPDLQPAP